MLNVALVIIQYLINKWKRIELLARYRKMPPKYLLKRDRSIQMKEKKGNVFKIGSGKFMEIPIIPLSGLSSN